MIIAGESFYEADILHYKMEKNINDHLAEEKDE